jgi:hypothetical protein
VCERVVPERVVCKRLGVYKVVCERIVCTRDVFSRLCVKGVCEGGLCGSLCVRVDVTKCRAFPAKRRLMSPSATPAPQNEG